MNFRNKQMFNDTVQFALKGIETISNYSGYDVSGVADDLMNDPEFILDLKVIQCEIDMSKYISVKSSAFMKVVKKMYMKNKENEMKKEFENVLNDKDKLEKIKNLG